MCIKQWYTALLEDRVFMSQEDDQALPTLIPARVETLHPAADWKKIWRRTRTVELSSDLTGFIFKLPTQNRISRLGGTEGDNLIFVKFAIQKLKPPSKPLFLASLLRLLSG